MAVPLQVPSLTHNLPLLSSCFLPLGMSAVDLCAPSGTSPWAKSKESGPAGAGDRDRAWEGPGAERGQEAGRAWPTGRGGARAVGIPAPQGCGKGERNAAFVAGEAEAHLAIARWAP